jgi:hypothetical protein
MAIAAILWRDHHWSGNFCRMSGRRSIAMGLRVQIRLAPAEKQANFRPCRPLNPCGLVQSTRSRLDKPVK